MPPSEFASDDLSETPDHGDRREFFRVDDRINLRYCRIDAEALDLPAESHFDNSEIFWLMRELRAVDVEHHSRLRGLAEHDRELGIYLKSINRKIELIASALAAFERVRSGTTPQPVSLSEGGLAFGAGEPLPPGALLALQLTLLPEYLGLAILGEVTGIDEQGRTGVSFLRLRQAERQILAKHILQVQIAARRQLQPGP